MRATTVLVAIAALGLSACSTYQDHLNRGQRLYDENEYEKALALWRVLEEDEDSLSLNDRARYAYLRGMTDYRLGFREDARHWLAVAKATEQEHPGGLTADWKQRVEAGLSDLNKDVFGGAEGAPQGSADAGAGGAAQGAATPDSTSQASGAQTGSAAGAPPPPPAP